MSSNPTVFIQAFTNVLWSDVSNIINELSKPGRDPRDDMPKQILRSDVLKFEDLKEGLQEAINFEKGTTPAKKITYIIAPVTEYNPTEIRAIRMDAGMTQNIFAN